ncbi:MAG: acetyl-CoA carboxylase carboxyl transferase subunit beta [Actinobacteria bacterium HGW-Actinobacteria-7]|jgi:acetyl-CoA carboxylase carboxyl transferase subunit beta|nr:MAG: acetyl-CoA carboxylase carboxyl transferase subunit beta [Actinobacteria bacterium HGW-Actinobacteria-7]
MPISDWFSAREARRYTRVSEGASAPASDVPDGVWIKCETCHKTIYEGDLVANMRVCPSCGHHFDVPAPQRIEMIADEGSFLETDGHLAPADPLSFVAAKSYAESLEGGRAKSGLNEGVVTGTAAIDGIPVVLGVMDFRFIGASMGSVVGEKIARAFELATERRLPVVMITASGGARMQEGMFSLMQMAKTSAAVQRHLARGLPYVSVLSNPTYGGVTASFPVLADVILAEPGASIGFTGPRIIEQTIRQKLPKGFQTSEFMLEHGLIDEVVPRGELRSRLALLLNYLTPRVSDGGAS